MPLRIVSRPGRSLLYVRGAVRGQSIFECAGTDDPRRAEAYRAKREAELWDASVYGSRAVVTFATAAQSYLTAEPRTEGTKALIRKLLLHFRTTPLGKIKQPELDRAYGALLATDASPATKLRNVLTPLRAIMEHAARRDWCDRPAFEVPKQPRPRVTFLRPDQATALVEASAPHIRPLIVFLIGTAARMSEALELDWQDVDLAASRVSFRETKTDVERWVDLVPAVRAALAALPHREGRVFRPAYSRRRAPDERGQQWTIGDAYRDAGRQGGGQVKSAWAGACRRAKITGLRMHDLRHTAATWHYAAHRDLLRLQQFGGWSSLAQVQVYAHLLPDAHTGAVRAWLGLSTPARTRNARA